MTKKLEIRLQLGEVAGKDFENFWNQEVAEGRIPPEMNAQFFHAKRPVGGLALSIPPEVVIAFFTGLVGSLGTELGKLLWRKLKEFFEKKESSQLPRKVVILIGDSRNVFDPANIPADPPSSLEEILKQEK